MNSNNVSSLVVLCCILATLAFVLACGISTNDLADTDSTTHDKEYLGQGVKFPEQVYSTHINVGQQLLVGTIRIGLSGVCTRSKYQMNTYCII